MAVATVNVTVIDPGEREFYTISELLSLCGVYRYNVTRATTHAEAQQALVENRANYFIISQRAWERWFKDSAPAWTFSRSIVLVADYGPDNIPLLDPEELTIGQLLVAMGSAARQRLAPIPAPQHTTPVYAKPKFAELALASNQ